MPYRRRTAVLVYVVGTCLTTLLFECASVLRRLGLWTVDVVAACMAVWVATEAVRIRNSTITVVLDSH